VGLHLAETGDAVGAPKKNDELFGQAGIEQSHEHCAQLR
jgi:hypothetical protein